MRFPRAATILARQLHDLDAKQFPERPQSADEPDGLNVVRAIRLPAGERVSQILEANNDSRVLSVEPDGDDVIVEFVTTIDADRTDPFVVSKVAAILDEQPEPASDPEPEPQPEPKPAKKAAAKRSKK